MENKKYLSGLITDAHLHAGNNLFGIIYQNCISFFDKNIVEFTRIVVDPVRPMDESDVDFLNQYKIVGTFYIDESGYIICDFASNYWKFTGIKSPNNYKNLIFSIYDTRLDKRWSEVYILEEEYNTSQKQD
ncbi:MAG: hypothetical protein MUC49_14540 [Raineya sp.]|jgi:hypothetical protein|nr:hypothetical protein [Raineya sp.]